MIMAPIVYGNVPLKLRHGEYPDAVMSFSRYMDNKRIALTFTTPDGEPLAVGTTNLDDVYLDYYEVIIKDWSENQGMKQSLIDAGIIGDVKFSTQTGFVIATVHDLLVPIAPKQ